MLSAGQHLNLALTGLAASLAAHPDMPASLAADHAAAFAALAGCRHGADWFNVMEQQGNPALPLPRLIALAGLSPLATRVALAVGLVEEEPRLAALLGDGRHATAGGIVACLRAKAGHDDPMAVKEALALLLRLGLVTTPDPARPRLDQPLTVPGPLWDALAGAAIAPPGTRLPGAALPLSSLILDEKCRVAARSAATLLQGHRPVMLVLRGPAGNGRRTLAQAICTAAGRPLLIADPGLPADPAGWALAGLVAAVSGAALLVAPPLGPGESLELAPLALAGVPLIVVLGRSGAVLPGGRALLGLSVPAPDPQQRRRLWQCALPGLDEAAATALAAQRLASGTIMAAAPAAQAAAQAAGRAWPLPADVAAALAELHDPRLEGLASRISLSEQGDRPALDAIAAAELAALERRCAMREALAAQAGAGPAGIGVRALFSGPSGTGKTMAARHLARRLGRELWRIDLAAVVSKYIGETEKALDRALAAAEARDLILLLDEGDALMARRTDVGNANDRYANLETNFLLQRLEDFSGIILITTNAADRIDSAFARRMDVVVPFRPPDAALRAAILGNLLAGSNISPGQLGEVSARCALTGGQLRNIALHARLLAMGDGRAPHDDDLLAAVAREYRKEGAHSPLKSQAKG